MTTQMITRLDPDLKERFTRIARAQGKTASEAVRELMEEYVRTRDPARYLDEIWARTAAKLEARGVTAGDVAEAIRSARSARR